MNRISYLILVGVAAGATLLAQGPSTCGGAGMGGQQSGAKAPIASSPIVEMAGKVTGVQIARGQGMPSLEIESNGQKMRIVLGSMRYLMQQNFNPKAGDQVSVKAYKSDTGLFAITVTKADGTVLKLRDDNGWPVWMGRGGMGHGGMGRCPGCGNQ